MKKTLGIGILMVIIGLVLFAFAAADAFGLVFRKVNIEDKTFGSYESGEVAEGEIKFVAAKIGTAEESRKLFFIPLGKTQSTLYLIANNGGYIMIDVREDTGKFDEITEQTAAYLAEKGDAPTSSAAFMGRAEDITDEQLAMLVKHYEDLNISPADWEFAVSSLVLVQFDLSLTVTELCICFGFIFIGIILMMISRRYRYGETVFVGENTPGEKAEKEKIILEKKAKAEEAKQAEETEEAPQEEDGDGSADENG